MAGEGGETLPPPKVLLAGLGSARRALGQHFILDVNLMRKLVALVQLEAGDRVIEIGPGPGALTSALLESPVRDVTVVEKDQRFVRALSAYAARSCGRLKVVEGDALKQDWAELVPSPRVVCGNLPFNIATALLVQWLAQARVFRRMAVMVQKEVAERLTARPGTKAYGRLSILATLICRCQIVQTLPASVFTPRPQVAAAVVVLEPLEAGCGALSQVSHLEMITAAAFQQRRKMVKTSLRGVWCDPMAALEACAIAPEARADQLSPQAYARLARYREGGEGGVV